MAHHESATGTTTIADKLHPAKDPLWRIRENSAKADYRHRIARTNDNITNYGASSDTYYINDRDDHDQWLQITAVGEDAELDDVLVDVSDDAAIDETLPDMGC